MGGPRFPSFSVLPEAIQAKTNKHLLPRGGSLVVAQCILVGGSSKLLSKATPGFVVISVHHRIVLSISKTTHFTVANNAVETWARRIYLKDSFLGAGLSDANNNRTYISSPSPTYTINLLTKSIALKCYAISTI